MPAITYKNFDFQNATVLSYQHSNNFLGDGTARMSSSKEISIEVLLKNINVLDLEPRDLYRNIDTGATEGVSESWDTFVAELASGSKNFAENITLNGHAFGKGTINSIEITEDNPIRVGYYRINISIPVEGNIDYLDDGGGNSYYKNFSTSLGSDSQYIKEINENFSLDIDEENKLEQTHSVTIQFMGEVGGKENPDAIEEARSVAEALFDSANAPSLGFIHQDAQTAANSTFEKHKTKKHYFTESYDLLSKICSFSKVYDSEQNEEDYSLKIITVLTLHEDGTVSVVERGEIKGESFEVAQAGVDTEVGKSYTRCQAAFTSHTGAFFGTRYGGGSEGNNSAFSALSTQPIEVGKQYTRKSKKASYSVTYSNDTHLQGLHKHVFTVELSEELNGKTAVTVSGELRPYKPVGVNADHPTNGLTAQLAVVVGAALGKAKIFYGTESNATAVDGNNLTLTRSDFTFPDSKLTATYTREFSDDVAFRYSDAGSSSGVGGGFKRMNVSISDNLPTFMRNTYVVPNKKDKFTLVHEPADGKGGQTNMGQRTINIEAILPRPTNNVFTVWPDINSQLTTCKKIAAQRLADVVSDFVMDPKKTLVYAESCEYNLDNNMNFSLNLTCNYTTPRDAADTTNMGIITREV